MATELHYPRRATFVERSPHGNDSEERRYQGPGTFEVPDDVVDLYLDRGWERPDADTEEATAAVDQPDPEAAAEAEADAESEDDGFDAAGFVDESWQAVKAAIEDGEADGHLEAVRDAEQDRDSPRSSVIEAVDQRQQG